MGYWVEKYENFNPNAFLADLATIPWETAFVFAMLTTFGLTDLNCTMIPLKNMLLKLKKKKKKKQSEEINFPALMFSSPGYNQNWVYDFP